MLSMISGGIENKFFIIAINKNGVITRLYDKEARREIIPEGELGNDLQLFQDGPEGEDAWNIHETFDKRRYPFEGSSSMEILERGPVRGVLRVKRLHRGSSFEQDIIVYASSRRIDFVTRVDWQERHTLLKVAFPLEIRSSKATYEIQFGAIERPTTRNNSWEQQKFEVPAQRWADLSETGYGVSLLNDSRYAYDAKGHVLRLTLLRGTIFPDPSADLGKHEFTYSLLPHLGSWSEAHTVLRAAELNVPAQAIATTVATGKGTAKSFISISGAEVALEALKAAEDGRGLIMRLYEASGGRGEISVNLGFKVTKVLECNLVEEDSREIKMQGTAFSCLIKPFQIRTFRIF